MTNTLSSGDCVRAIDIMPVKVTPVQVIQNPARTGPGRAANRSPIIWDVIMGVIGVKQLE